VNPTIKLSSPATKEFWEIPVLYEDEHLLAISKPSGLLCSPDRADMARPSLMKLLHQGIEEAKPWARERGLSYLANVHRLEVETSGVLLLARNKPALVTLANLFGSEKPLKEYLALVQNTPLSGEFEVDAKLGPHPTQEGMMRVDQKQGKRSRTRFLVAEGFQGWTLLRCQPLTDRPHQIRVHLRHAGYPIVGDQLYGGKTLWLSRLKPGYRLKPGREERPLLNRVALHAHRLTLPHPVTGATVEIEAPLPKDLQVALKYLRKQVPLGTPLPGPESDRQPEPPQSDESAS
jgi:RluA family pseudouridine synthase